MCTLGVHEAHMQYRLDSMVFCLFFLTLPTNVSFPYNLGFSSVDPAFNCKATIQTNKRIKSLIQSPNLSLLHQATPIPATITLPLVHRSSKVVCYGHHQNLQVLRARNKMLHQPEGAWK